MASDEGNRYSDESGLSPEVRPRFKALSKDELAVQALIHDLKKCQPDEDLISSLHSQARRKIVSLQSRTKDLQRLSIEQDTEKERQAVLENVRQHQETQSSLQMALRKAALECQNLLEQHRRSILLEAADTGGRAEITDRAAAEAASQVTEKLLHLRQTMAGVITRDRETMEVLDSSSKVVRSVDSDLRGVSNLVTQSKHLIAKYGRRQVTDCLLITMAFLVFLATVVYIIMKRLF